MVQGFTKCKMVDILFTFTIRIAIGLKTQKFIEIESFSNNFLRYLLHGGDWNPGARNEIISYLSWDCMFLK